MTNIKLNDEDFMRILPVLGLVEFQSPALKANAARLHTQLFNTAQLQRPVTVQD